MEEFIQTPGSPNLYWALTDLPRPFIDMRRAYEGERLMIENLFPGVREMLANKDARLMSEAEVQVQVGRLIGLAQGLSIRPNVHGWEGRLGGALLAAEVYPRAKRFLLSQGHSPKDVEAMPVVQVAMMYEVHNYDRLYDDFAKWASLPYWEAYPGMRQADQALRQAKAAGPQTGTTLATLLLPAVNKVQFAQARTERRIAALRIIEGLRLYAAAHPGQLPARLDDIKEVPIPLDPVTGGPFAYTVDGNHAVLHGPPPGREEAGPHNALRYDVTLQH